MQLKSKIKSLFNLFGLEIRRLSQKSPPKPDHIHHVNAYLDQKILLAQKEVHTIFDIGANIGQTVHEYHNLFSKSLIYSFEPFEETYTILSKRFDNTDTIKTFKLAIAEQTGSKRFYFNKANYTNSLLEVDHNSGKYVDTNLTDNLGYIEVETISIDDFCKRENIEKIQILKMDIQGAELMALRGAINLLQANLIDLIYTEVQFTKIYENQANFYDIYEYLVRYGYILYGLYDLNYGKNGVLAWGDAIFISTGLEQSLS